VCCFFRSAVDVLITMSFSLLMLPAALAVSVVSDPPPSFFNCSAQPDYAFEPVTLMNSRGLEASMIAYGATMTHLLVPDASGAKRDVLLGWDDRTQYCASAQHTYFGATIGRIANRVANCSFGLEGQTYDLSCNEHDFDTLHGGVIGFDRQVWKAVARSSNSVTWSHFSPDGEMGFPGDLQVNVTHTITDDNEWTIGYSALAGGKTTVVAMSNHAYFNLNANVNNTPTVLEHILHMPTAKHALEVSLAPDYHLIPSGKVIDIARGSALDFTDPKPLGTDIDRGVVTAEGGYDNAWIFEPAPRHEQHVVSLSSPLTGIRLDMSTDQPSVQVYTGNFLNGNDDTQIPRKASQTFGDKAQFYQWRGAVTLEAQQYPDAVHHNNFPSVELEAGKRYTQRTSYRFSVQHHPLHVMV